MVQKLAAFLTKAAKLDIREMRSVIAKEAKRWTQETTSELVASLNCPAISAEQAGIEKQLRFEWPLRWATATVESLGWLGLPGFVELWKIASDHPDENIALRALVVALRQPLLSEADRDQLLDELAKRLPKFFRSGIPIRAILYDMCQESSRNAEMTQLLTQLSSVIVLGPKKSNKQLLGDVVSAIMNAAKPTPVPEDPSHLSVAKQFLQHIVAGKLEEARALMSKAMQKVWTVDKLRKEVQQVTSHCGWPTSIDEEPYFAGFRYSDLADGPAEPRLPKWVSDTNFRGWVWASLAPPADADCDFACNLGIALIDETDQIRIGYFWMTAED